MNLKSKIQELEKVREELHELISKRGVMLGTSHFDPAWSEAKAFNWGKDIEKLQEKEQSILDEISQFKHSPEFVSDLETKTLALDNRINKLLKDLEKSQSQLAYKPGEAAEAIIAGEDPLKTAAEYKALQDKIELIKLAIEHCRIASTILITLGEDVPYNPIHGQTMDPHSKIKVPLAEKPHVRVS